jgi:hypothetical protein
MKLSTIIARCQEIQKRYGDITCMELEEMSGHMVTLEVTPMKFVEVYDDGVGITRELHSNEEAEERLAEDELTLASANVRQVLTFG